MDILKYKKIYLGISTLLVVGSIVLIIAVGLKLGIDFSGGTLWHLRFENDVTKTELEEFFRSQEEITTSIVLEEADGYIVRLNEIGETSRQEIAEELRSNVGEFEELRFESIGAVIGSELRRKSQFAAVLVLIAISLYVAFAFRKVSAPVKSWKYGIITLLTLFHDVIVSIGFFIVLGIYTGAEVDISFVVALLVIMGFSVHDTIVIFDRIRESLMREKGPIFDFNGLVNRSVNETLARSINTSLTLVLVLVALLIVGVPSLENFVLVLLAGTIAGAYSSIFVASPLLTLQATSLHIKQ